MWVDDGLGIAVDLADGGDALPREDRLTFLKASVDAVADAVANAADGEAAEVPDPRLDRGEILDALSERLEGLGAAAEVLDGGPCPFLGEEAVSDVVEAAHWPIEPALDRAVARAAQWLLECQFGEEGDFRTVTVRFGRPRSVPELTALVEGPIPAYGTDRTIRPLDTTNPDVNGRAYVVDRDGAATVGWIDNGLRIEVLARTDDDPETVLTAVVPAVLDNLMES